MGMSMGRSMGLGRVWGVLEWKKRIESTRVECHG